MDLKWIIEGLLVYLFCVVEWNVSNERMNVLLKCEDETILKKRIQKTRLFPHKNNPDEEKKRIVMNGQIKYGFRTICTTIS